MTLEGARGFSGHEQIQDIDIAQLSVGNKE